MATPPSSSATPPEDSKTPVIHAASHIDEDIDGSSASLQDPVQIMRSKRFGKKAGRSKRSPATGGRRLGGNRILLVEDVRVSQRIARVSLTRAKYKVDVAGDAKSAVDQWLKNKHKVVLMDINLGKGKQTGVDATKEIRAKEKELSLPRTVIFGLTGCVDEEDIEMYKTADMDGVIAKGNVIAEAVKEAVEEHKKDPSKFVLARLELSK